MQTNHITTRGTDELLKVACNVGVSQYISEGRFVKHMDHLKSTNLKLVAFNPNPTCFDVIQGPKSSIGLSQQVTQLSDISNYLHESREIHNMVQNSGTSDIIISKVNF